ncbi:hypothetical protein FDP41_002388 [Naegleria fowleri]|uniref:Regulator of telomere elongation helicase 1 homolog n=1 Tax=Naegleria fowleri TaxID=5763 RepID=A0A6A5BXU4_NAEFO|nr:uncharacterized protein FDP41_002388 [Naegleria fowleri]KAF0978568.1 hypothetical protein FDP41_002388 [Naegleria fowleri]
MPEYIIRGVTVNFPYQAYPCQELYMERVIQCLQESIQEKQENPIAICSRNALLESPTGTGKTMCLLCSAYAWLIDYKKKSYGTGTMPKIIFTSRTHSQLTHAIQELKRSAYVPEIVVMGSREQMCVNPDVVSLKGFQQVSKCSSLVRSGGCKYHAKFTEMKKSGDLFHHETEDEIEDIEDLLTKGLKNNFCPFFYAREKQKCAEIIFMPYNYLIDPLLRKKVNVDITNSIIIFDEAHNIQKLCAEASSFDFSAINICKAIAEIEKCRSELDKISTDPLENARSLELKTDCLDISSALLDLDIHLDDMEISDDGYTATGDTIFDIFSYASVHPSTWESFNEKIKSICNFLQSKKQNCSGLERVKEAIERIFSDFNSSSEVFKNYFKVFIYYSKRQPGVMNTNLSSEHLQLYSDVLSTRDRKKDFRKTKTLSFWCFNPGISMQKLASENPLAFILTSGTLSPMESFAYELGLNFPIRLENPHVVSKDQICVMVAQTGPTGTKLNSSYTNRASESYLREIGGTLLNLSKIVPDGLLVFFPSYTLMDQCVELWKKSMGGSKSIWESVSQNKIIIVEPKESTKLNQSIRDYEDSITNRKEKTTGACFFAVCRGRVSEGLDFKNRNGRCCMIVGLPFPPLHDLKVKLKRDYLDETAQIMIKENPNAKPMTGSDWYAQESSRAVNQAIGRIIRHRYDYGAVVLCDERFVYQNQRKQLSKWLQPHVKVANQFGEISNGISMFFKNAFQKFGLESEKVKPPNAPVIKKLPRFSLNLTELYNKSKSTSELLPQRNIYHEDYEEYRNEIGNIQDVPLTEEGITPQGISSSSNSLQHYKNSLDVSLSVNDPKRSITKQQQQPNIAGQRSSVIPSISSTATTTSNSNNSNNNNTNHHSVTSSFSSLSPKDHPPLKRNVVLNSFVNPNSEFLNPQLRSSPSSGHSTPVSSKTSSTSTLKESQSSSSSSSKNSAEYLQQVKSTLTADQYKEFKNLLIQFREHNSKDSKNTSNTFLHLVKKLIGLFGASNIEIIEKFKNFISPKLHNSFDEIVKKQILLHGDEDSKKRKQEHVQFDLVSGTLTKKTKTLPLSNTSSKPIVIEDDDKVNIPLKEDIPLTLESCSDLTTTDTINVNFNINTSSSIHQQPIQTDQEEPKPTSGTVCSICKEPCKEPTAAKCGHVNCYSCWQQWLNYKLECPTCKSKVRPKLLTRLFF